MSIRTAFAVGLVGILLSAPVHAEGPGTWLYEVRGGVLAHDVGGLWSGARRETGTDFNLEATFTPKVRWIGADIRPAVGITVNGAGDTSKAYLDSRWEWTTRGGLFVVAGIGAAVHDGDLEFKRRDRKALGSRLLFHFPLEIGYRFDGHHGISVFFDHVSNAWLASPNEGMDTLGIRYGYRF